MKAVLYTSNMLEADRVVQSLRKRGISTITHLEFFNYGRLAHYSVYQTNKIIKGVDIKI